MQKLLLSKELIIEILLYLDASDFRKLDPIFLYSIKVSEIKNKDIHQYFYKNNIFINFKSSSFTLCEIYEKLKYTINTAVSYSLINKFLQDKDSKKYIGNNIITFSVANKYFSILKLFVKYRNADPSSYSNFGIKYSSDYGYFKIAKFLLKDPRVNPSADNNYSIKTASENGHFKIVKLLLRDYRVNPSANNNYSINHAMNNKHYKIAILLLKDPRVSINYFKMKHRKLF